VSAPFDYSGLQATAVSLISRFGRAVSLKRGVKGASPAQALTVTAVFVAPDRTRAPTAGQFREPLAVERRRYTVFFTPAAAFPEKIGTDWWIEDGTERYAFESVALVKPGGTELVYRAEAFL